MNEKNAQFKAIPDGPLEITGQFTIVEPDGKEIKKEGPVYLCRCGASKNKPYCDGTHKNSGFSG